MLAKLIIKCTNSQLAPFHFVSNLFQISSAYYMYSQIQACKNSSVGSNWIYFLMVIRLFPKLNLSRLLCATIDLPQSYDLSFLLGSYLNWFLLIRFMIKAILIDKIYYTDYDQECTFLLIIDFESSFSFKVRCKWNEMHFA